MRVLASLIIACVPYLDGGMLCRQGDDGGPFVIVPKGHVLQVNPEVKPVPKPEPTPTPRAPWPVEEVEV